MRSFAALPPDVRKGSAFPDGWFTSLRLRLEFVEGVAFRMGFGLTESHRLSALCGGEAATERANRGTETNE